MTRRLIAIVLLSLGIQLAGFAQPAQPAQQLRKGVYLLKGGAGANTGFIVGSKEVIVIDAKMTADAAKAMLAEIAKVTPNPVKYIVLTHSDGDHVNGLVGFPKGLTIVSSANCKKEMEEAFKDPKMSELAAYLPTRTFAAAGKLDIDGAHLELLPVGPAHTSGDMVVYLPAQKLAFVGDLVFQGREPLIHHQKGGTSTGVVETMKKLLALDADMYLAGHTEPMSKADIQTAMASIQDKQAKIKALIDQGKSLDEIKTATGVPAGAARFPSLTEVIYMDLTAKK
jgi:cyclase